MQPMEEAEEPSGGNIHKRDALLFSLYRSEHSIDTALDELDDISARDIAMARYKRNHDYLSEIFTPYNACKFHRWTIVLSCLFVLIPFFF